MIFQRWSSAVWKFYIHILNCINQHARTQKVLSVGVQLWCFYLAWWGEERSKYHYKRTIIGPPAKRHLNGVSLACQWWPYIECSLGSFVIFKGIQTSFAKKPYIFVIFQGGGGSGSPVPPPFCIGKVVIPLLDNKNKSKHFIHILNNRHQIAHVKENKINNTMLLNILEEIILIFIPNLWNECNQGLGHRLMCISRPRYT